MYYTEITKIIEAGMRKDPTKVASYSRLLAKKLSNDGDERASNRVLSVLDKMGNGHTVMDTLTTMPVDQESRLDIADIDYAPNIDNLILSDSAEDMLKDFVATVKSKNKMMSLGLEFRNTLLLYGPRDVEKQVQRGILRRNWSFRLLQLDLTHLSLLFWEILQRIFIVFLILQNSSRASCFLMSLMPSQKQGMTHMSLEN